MVEVKTETGVGDQTWIIVPCYNEAARLDREAFEAAMGSRDAPVFLFVDDGSTDATPVVLEGMRRRGKGRCHVHALPENRGKAEAVRQGLSIALAAGAARVGYWDADLATPLEAVADLARELDLRPQVEVVLGSRVRILGRTIQRSHFRHYVGRVYATLASLSLRLPVYDTQCGAKLFRRSAALESALGTPFRSRWAFDVELLQRLQDSWRHSGADRIVEVPLQRWVDVGESKVSLLAGARATLFLLGLTLRRARRPGKAPDVVQNAPAPDPVASFATTAATGQETLSSAGRG